MTGAAAASAAIVPRHVLGGQAAKSPSDKLNIAGIGVGAMGGEYLKSCESENIVALCDVDPKFAAKTFERYPSAKIYTDFRVLLEKEKGIDAVVIGTPDHTHAVIAMAAIQNGKHVYCAKPMTRTVAEARRVAKAAREARVATQMSAQSCASDAAWSTAEWIQAGAAGPIREVHVWTDRPVWPQGLARPSGSPPAPSQLAWDLWLGPAASRPYNSVYHPFNWRGWVDFGTGAIGDMACHTLHVIFRSLDLQYPESVEATSAFVMVPDDEKPDMAWMRSRRAKTPETFPHASIVTWRFPARGGKPPVRMVWYEGGLKPPRPEGFEPDKRLPGSGLYFVGDQGVLMSGFTGGPRLLPESKNASYTPPVKTHARSAGHYQEWIEAAKGGKPANCNFDFASLLTETALLGTVAIRSGRYLEWDHQNMRISNDADANRFIAEPYRAGWSL